MFRMPDVLPRKTLYLIDGHAQFFRAYHAIRTGMTSPVTKEPTNLTFGFVGMLLKVLREYKPDYLAVVIDAAGDRETFRSEIYPEYKATRKETPNDFHPQVERCLQIMEKMCIPVVGIPGVEADDAIATIVTNLKRDNPDLHIRIVSKDKDLAQLLSERVELFDVHKDTSVTAETIFETPGIKPENVVDILTLMGDTVDNVPGVPGVGPKTAGALILQFGSVENLLRNLDQIKGKRRENIEAAKDKLHISRQLVQLKDDLEIDFHLDDAVARCERLPVNELLAMFRELGFNRYQDELKALAGSPLPSGEGLGVRERTGELGISSAPSPRPSPKGRGDGVATLTDGLFSHLEESEAKTAGPSQRGEYNCITTPKELDALIKQIKKAGIFAVDTETDGLSPLDANLCGISISLAPKTGVYIPTCSPDPSQHMNTQTVIEKMRPVLEDPKIRKIGHNLKFDINVLRKHGVRLRAEVGGAFDTMVASYIVDPGRSSHSMDVLALALLNHTCIPITDLIGKGKNQRTFDCAPLDQATEYSAEDADITYRLHECFLPKLNGVAGRKLFDEVEMPLVEVLAELEWNGIRVDPEELDRQKANLSKQIDVLRRQILDAAPGNVPFNPDSPKQLAAVLFNKPNADPPGLGLRPTRRGKSGTPSTDQEVLERLAGDPTIASPLPRLIVEYRQLTKLVNTYLESLKEAINPKTGRIHASFNQTVAVTGRLSSSDPNLQNIPIRTEVGREIRRAFVAEPGNALMTADYSQIELRILAHLSDDPRLIEAFEKGVDIHAAVAGEVFGVPIEQVSKSQRNSAKMVNFGIVYGVTPTGLARRLQLAGTDTTVQDAARIINDYKARYAKIAEFLDRCVHQAMTQGYVQTILGRRRSIPQIFSNDQQTRALGERLAINSVVQGSAADLIKIAMIDIHRALESARGNVTPTHCNGWASTELRSALQSAKMLVQIHDELVFEAPKSDAEALAAFVKQRMQAAMKLKVPLVADAAWSENWIDAK
jgi:DNA polymerase-1